MLEGVLDERDEQQRRHVLVRIAEVRLELHVDRLGQTDLHQIDVVLKEQHLLAQLHTLTLIIVEHVS